jgi:glyoxylase-like metal-dependent hydrolase (beta-lactamase superfamily II)
MELESPWIESFMVGDLQMRCSVVTDLATGDTIIIDGGGESDRIISWIEKFEGLGPNWSTGPQTLEEMNHNTIPNRKVVALVNTHAHYDHSGHIPYLLDRYDVDWYLHEDDYFLQTLAKSSAARRGIILPEPAEATKQIKDEQILQFGSISLKILHTPGHTLGGCCLLLKVSNGPDHLFVGDTLFAGSVGRTDLPNTGGDFEVLSNSIKTKLWPLNLDTVVHPGHGPLTSIGIEKLTNPYVGQSSQDDNGFIGKYM